MPLPLYGGFAVPHGGCRRQGVLPAAGGVLADAQNEGMILLSSVLARAINRIRGRYTVFLPKRFRKEGAP